MRYRTAKTCRIEDLVNQHLEMLTHEFFAMAQIENDKFLRCHPDIAVTIGAAAGAHALNSASMRIFANMISRLPANRREAYIENLVSRYEPSLRTHIDDAAKVLNS